MFGYENYGENRLRPVLQLEKYSLGLLVLALDTILEFLFSAKFDLSGLYYKGARKGAFVI